MKSINKYLLFLGIVSVFASCKKENGLSPKQPTLNELNAPYLVAPVASFTYAHTSGSYFVSFTSTSTAASTYYWDFGDGTNSTSANPTHTYTTLTSKTVTLTVTNSSGSDSDTQTITLAATSAEFFTASMTGSGSPFTYTDISPTATRLTSGITIYATTTAGDYMISLPYSAYSGGVYSTSVCGTGIQLYDSSGDYTYANCSYYCYPINITITGLTTSYIAGTIGNGRLVTSCSGAYSYWTFNSGSFSVNF